MNYCPRCATALEDKFVYERVRRVCPSCDFIFFREPKVAAGALIEQDGKLVLIRRSVDPQSGHWALPAGYVEYDEGPVTAAIRECREETGLSIRITGLFGIFHSRIDPRGPAVLLLYNAKIDSGELKAGDDAEEAGFFGPDELPANIAFASTRRALLRWCIKQHRQ